jgi:hypothetical protein
MIKIFTPRLLHYFYEEKQKPRARPAYIKNNFSINEEKLRVAQNSRAYPDWFELFLKIY